MTVEAKVGFIYDGVVRKQGEIFDAVGYAFTWLTDQGWVDPAGVNPAPPEPKDDLLATTEGLPPLEPTPKKGKK